MHVNQLNNVLSSYAARHTLELFVGMPVATMFTPSLLHGSNDDDDD